ncbi:MAG: DUF2029 domain-containing protein [Candidatus Eremiobacteraeota bacterium]|nr:DUF2029 domain-containing protein [Candidatus Eremiobacteraeota bacterium]
MRQLWINAAIVLAALTALGIHTGIVTRSGFLMGDFRAFYCAARVASHGGDPYRTEPLRTCETAIGPEEFFEKNAGVTIPAPLPGYAIAALMPLGALPFWPAAALWGALLALACVASIVTLARLAGMDWGVGLGAFALSLGMLSLPFGEVVPLAVAAICLSAHCAARGRARAAALFAAAAMIEPHLGLPACVALAAWRPATRVPLTLAFGVLGVLSLAALGGGRNVEYFTSVLPAHALSELTRDTQYSLTAVLASVGVPAGAALRAGSLWYLGMLAAGAIVAGLLARRTRNDAFLAAIPPAFAVFGGTFIHVTQIAVALPAAALLVAYSPRERRALAVVALLALAVPWGWFDSPALLLAPLFPIAYLAWRYWPGNLAATLLAAIAAAVLLFGVESLHAVAAPQVVAHAAAAIDPRLPEASWSVFTQKSSTGSLAAWVVRIPTWAALALLLVLATAAASLRLRASHALAIGAAAVATLLPIAAQTYNDRSSRWLAVDFRAYYCAALAQREGFSPYYVQPLHDCEHATPAPFYRAPAKVTVPAPYPPYALTFFYPLTLFSFDTAATIWWYLLAAAVAVAAYALSRIARQPVAVAWAALALSLGLTSFASGNVMPIALAAIVVAALCAARDRCEWAALAIAVAAIEPQIALPAALGLFVAYPRIRVSLCVAGAALAALSLLGGGLTQTIAYVTAVLPAHALAEVSRDNQYSLSTILTALGVADTSAALAGSMSYVAMTALGVFAAVRLARRYDNAAFAALVPPAFSLLGGTFVHTEVIAAAVPACLLAFSLAQTQRAWLLAALLLLAVPWMLATSAALFLAPLFPAAYLAYALWGDRTIALIVGVASLAVIVGLFTLAHAPVHAPVHSHVYPPIDPMLAEASWRDFVLGNVTNRPAMWLLRLPTWIGLVTFAVPTLLLCRREPSRFAMEARLSESRA